MKEDHFQLSEFLILQIKNIFYQMEVIFYMQIKTNREVRDYKEEVYFGMNLRQLAFSALAGGAALCVYFLCSRRMPMEAGSWLCVAAAVPFGAFGFVRWHGMNFEKIIGVFIRSRLVLNRPLFYRPDNPYKAFTIYYNNERKKVQKRAAK